MFIAHLPSGYLLCKTVAGKMKGVSWRAILLAGLMGSVIPDVDLLYFYLIDARQHSHHSYPSHIPIYWLSIYLICVVTFYITKKHRLVSLASVFMLGVLLHLLLDSVAGGILWAYPFSTTYFVVTTVPAQYDWWVLNFILHWTFAIEAVIVVSAWWVYSE